MALDPTAREANYKDSIKKYLVDSLVTTESLKISFDPRMYTPETFKSTNPNVKKWVAVKFGNLYRDDMSEAILEIRCCTRQDSEGFQLSQLTDKVIGYFSTESGDGIKRITFYRSYPSQAWDTIGGIVVQDIRESREMEAADDTLYKVITIILRFASKI